MRQVASIALVIGAAVWGLSLLGAQKMPETAQNAPNAWMRVPTMDSAHDDHVPETVRAARDHVWDKSAGASREPLTARLGSLTFLSEGARLASEPEIPEVPDS